MSAAIIGALFAIILFVALITKSVVCIWNACTKQDEDY